MRTFIACLFVGSAVAAPQDEKKPNRFLELNPGYRERAGAFYEKTYLGPAAESLAKAVAVERLTKEAASGVLRQYIYDWLDGYIAGEGEMSRAAHAAVVKRADLAMNPLLDDGPAFQRWVEWRENLQPGGNVLAFITSARVAMAGLPLTLPESFAKEGWTRRSLEDDEQVAPYQRGFPALPHQVLLFEQENGVRIALIVFRAGRAQELLAALEKAGDPDLRVFRRTMQFVVFAVETGAVPESLKERLRRQLVTK
ncbi:MAG: hypothetical protein HY293_04735 [Planctomycetes bacterium]|nr:hypothetical protein [Planctomycetota bacterium]